MRILKWFALVAIALAVVAIAIYFRRDTIARGIANSLLDEQEFRVQELSIDTLTTDRLELSELVIESLSGARYEVYGLALPLSGTAPNLEQISAERLVVSYERTRDLQTMLSTTLQAVLDLPFVRPDVEAKIDRVSLPGLPDLTRIVWTTLDAGQELGFDLETIRVTVGTERVDDQKHRLIISAIHEKSAQILSAALELLRLEQKYSAKGQAKIQTAAWLPILKLMDLLPASLARIDAELYGPIEILFDKEAAGHAEFSAQLALQDDLRANLEPVNGQATHIHTSSLEQLTLHLDYPSFAWRANAERVMVTVRRDDLNELPIRLDKLDCQSGIRCTMLSLVDVDNFQWNGYEFDNVTLSAPVAIESGDQTRVEILPDSTGLFTGVRTSGLVAEEISVSSFTGTHLLIKDNDWHCHIDELQLIVKQLSGVQKLSASAPITFSDFTIRDSARNVETQLSISAGNDASWNGTPLYLPGVAGTLSIRDEQLTSSFKLTDSRDALSADVDVSMDLSTNSGSLDVSNARLSFDHANLSEFVPGWARPWDIVAGSWDGRLDIKWRAEGNATAYRGTMAHNLDALSGKYNDIAFRGLSTEATATLDSSTGFEVAPSSIAVRLLDVGMPLEHIAADYTVDPNEQAVNVQNLSIAALGGEFVADPFRLSATASTNVIMLRAKSVQLQLMLDLAKFEAVEMTGAISGELPVTMGQNNITIEGGRLESDPPGGVIRYRAGDDALDAAVPDSNLDVVTQALNNFEYASLSSDVDYTESGDLKLQMRLSGINPDVDATQPVILNLGVENNVPQLLRSLRAIRSIEDILEQRTED